MTSLHERLVRRFGDGVTDWVAAAPASAAQLAAEWDLTLGETFPHGSTSLTLVATTADGRACVLKMSPDTEFLAKQERLLRAWAPSGHVPEVVRSAPGAVLLERVVPGTPVVTPDPVAFAALLDGLHSVPVPDNVEVGDLAPGTEVFLARTEAQLARSGPAELVLPSDLALARAERDRLAATARTPVLLHGDLHYSNLLDAGARGLLAIDPTGALGEREFDAVDFVLDATEPVERRIDRIVAVTDLDAERLAGWCRVAAPTIAVGLHRRGQDPADILRFLRA